MRDPRPTPTSQRTFGPDANAAAFPLGGIGTGNVSLGARAELRDWEIFNRQGKGNFLPCSFFAIHCAPQEGDPVTRVLEARLRPPYTHLDGYRFNDAAGLPRLAGSTMRGEYPFAWIEFEDDDLPLTVTLEAFTPFVPLDADESGLPAAVLRYRVVNPTAQPIDVSIAGSLTNAVGFRRFQPYRPVICDGKAVNTPREGSLARGLSMTSDLPPDHLTFGTMALATRAADVSMKLRWLPTWWDGLGEFWQDFSDGGRIGPPHEAPAFRSHYGVDMEALPPTGSVAVHERIEAGGEASFEFFVCWHFPNRERRWGGYMLDNADLPDEGLERNHYATRFDDAWDVVEHLGAEIHRLDRHTRDFHSSFFGGTLPASVLDAAASNISIIRSTTCFRIADGTLLAWEGGMGDRGSCEGSCTHVWNYAQTMAHLFPELERSMRRVEFLLEADEEGAISFRTNRVFGRPRWSMVPAADGQLGTIVRLHREWRLSGDDEFLRELWPAARRALDFSLARWDTDGDLVLDGEQHNTYDIEFYGPNSLTSSLLLAALKAGAAIAAHLGETEAAARYADLGRRSAERVDELLWNGEYYDQRLADVDEFRYQYGSGCLSDQLLGQTFAGLTGLGYVLPPEKVRAAITAVYEYNFRRSLAHHADFERVYALNEEAGLVLCTWPRGGRPALPFVYADEVWSGTEYAVASLLIHEGLVDEGLKLVGAVRDRYDGYKRNPWNEVECGDHYARSLASWGVYTALCGSDVDMVNGSLRFEPAVGADDFAAFFVAGGA